MVAPLMQNLDFDVLVNRITASTIRILTFECFIPIKADNSVFGWYILKVVYCRLVHKSAL